MRNSTLTVALLSALVSTAYGQEPVGLGENLPKLGDEHMISVKAESHAPLLEADRDRAKAGKPIRYASPRHISDVRVEQGEASAGLWSQTKSGDWVWRLAIESSGASSLDFGFKDFFLPHGAAMHIYDDQKNLVRGPFTDQHNNADGSFWTPVVPGPRAVIEVFIPAIHREHVSLELTRVNYGYRFFTERPFALNKSLSCNVDVVCSEGDSFRDQIRSVAAFTSGTGTELCSGAVVNTTAGDSRPYFLTADHCNVTSGVASGAVFYFNYQSAECRQGVASGMRLPRSDFDDVMIGASLVSTYTPSDFTLLEFNDPIPTSYNVFYAGWDRTGNPLDSAYSIHHPSLDEKRLSIENDPVSNATTSNPNVGWAPDTHFEIERWDVGITEGGSSGSPLFDQNNRIVGQLTGGATFACPGAEEGLDYYGLIEVSWEGGGTPASRLRDWLDPAGTNPVVLDGQNGCDTPQATIISTKGSLLTVGQTSQFSTTVSGGQAPYTFSWDLDGDGRPDSTDAAPQAVYHQAYTGNVDLLTTDATGCQALTSFGVVVEAPDLELSQVGTPSQVCGDNDADIEPGEAWSFPVTLRNNGVAASNAYAAFGVSGASTANTKLSGGPDNFGYTFADSNEALCSFDFQDISNSGETLNFTATNPGSDIPALDDGWADIVLGASSFDFYGENLATVTMTTNGYMSTDQRENGIDTSNDCPVPDVLSSGFGGRFYPLHSDMILESGHYQYFPTCPRPGEAAGSAGCDIFQWNVQEFFNGPTTEGLMVQAILYEGTHQIVYQYSAGNALAGEQQTVGLQNATANDGLTYACNAAGSVADNSAVCIFHPDSDNPLLSDAIKLEQGAVALGSAAAGSSTQVDVTVQLDESFACGASFAADYLGTAHSGGFSGNSAGGAITGTVPGSCDVITSCRAASPTSVTPKEGFWFSPLRPGNGIDLHFSDIGLYSAWYTAEKDRSPIWYYVTSLAGQAFANDTVTAEILKFQSSGDIRQTAPTSQSVGQARFSFINDSEAVMTYTLDGESNGELIQFFNLTATADVDPVLTDQYFNPDESGWGLGTQRQGNQEFSAVYFYDTEGQPRWVVVTSDGSVLTSQGTADLASFKAHCPGCTWTPVTLLNGGDMTRTLNSDGSAILDAMDVQVDGDVTIQWQRSNLPLQQVN